MHGPGLQLARPSAVIFQGSLRKNCTINSLFLRISVYTSTHQNILVLGSTFPIQLRRLIRCTYQPSRAHGKKKVQAAASI
jgi:hypothetical protein